MEIEAVSNVSFERESDELQVFQIVLAVPKQIPPTIGFDRSASHEISLPEHYLQETLKF